MGLDYYRSLKISDFNADDNGDDIDTDAIIEDGVAHSFISRVRPRLAEQGGERYKKFYIKANSDIIDIGVDISMPSTCPTEEVYFFQAGSNAELESDLDKDNIRLYGGFITDTVDNDNKQVKADRDVSNFIKANDYVTFFKTDDFTKITTLEVDSVDTDTITFKDMGSEDITTSNGSSDIQFDSLDKDDYIGFWIYQTVAEWTHPMEDPLDNFVMTVYYDEK